MFTGQAMRSLRDGEGERGAFSLLHTDRPFRDSEGKFYFSDNL